MPAIKPTVSRIVLYRMKNGEQRPAIITHVYGFDSDVVDLVVFKSPKDPGAQFVETKEEIQQGDDINQWNWSSFQKDQQVGYNKKEGVVKGE